VPAKGSDPAAHFPPRGVPGCRRATTLIRPETHPAGAANKPSLPPQHFRTCLFDRSRCTRVRPASVSPPLRASTKNFKVSGNLKKKNPHPLFHPPFASEHFVNCHLFKTHNAPSCLIFRGSSFVRLQSLIAHHSQLLTTLTVNRDFSPHASHHTKSQQLVSVHADQLLLSGRFHSRISNAELYCPNPTENISNAHAISILVGKL